MSLMSLSFEIEITNEEYCFCLFSDDDKLFLTFSEKDIKKNTELNIFFEEKYDIAHLNVEYLFIECYVENINIERTKLDLSKFINLKHIYISGETNVHLYNMVKPVKIDIGKWDNY